MNYWIAFITGLTAGGLSCMALQGGLLASILVTQKQDKPIHPVWPTLMFLISKILAYTILGGLLGYFGSFFELSDSVKITFQVIAAVLMLGMAAHMLNLHPVFRYFAVQPPKWTGKLLRKQSHNKSFFAPVALGIFTVFIPCGVTQAMEVAAIASGNPFAGSLIMFSFTLGTAPLFLVLGFLTTSLSESLKKNFFRVAAALVIFIALSSINGALVLAGSNYSFDKWVWAFEQTFMTQKSVMTQQNVAIKVSSGGYTPSKFSVRSGQKVTLNLETNNNYSCTSIFTIPQLGINKQLPTTGNTEISFVPEKPGLLTFSCGMGMYSGTIQVI
jgi:uncharacterized protein